MENQPYLFLGFHLEKINFQKNQIEDLQEIRISISSYGYDEEECVFSLSIVIELDYENSKNNELHYIAGYKIQDEETMEDIKRDKNINDYISVFVSFVIPFIRSNITSITIDSGTAVVLPTINCRTITLDKTIVLSVDK